MDVFYIARIVVLKVIQFEKISTELQKSVLIDYSNNNWYTNIYHHYIK